ncbi:hypothetical protein N474_22645 [Pseudoalteromonas luteoviolacea CPMOR-2]|uniref:Uncharacterized protein n=1 Tax=Pseudoalteromonas luteoviolacea DSM 6061 TaxID=1365250 RepID=A0A161ZTF2_9GAMM|nr:hypothetical protein [Pseudoalteromonas luteoviolacea]KZN31800.1 hypothetical protein N475_22700 [Pseudoalteromonas luteoviolacea DSM 6061]KZN52772.1 hypothetical protein N474_22645 [Pseudoalteromonas luteoviolacea CPMOR-2]
MKMALRKETLATTLCITFAFLLLSTGLYDFFFNSYNFIELLNTCAVFCFLTGLGLSPKIFFTPIRQLLSASFVMEPIVSPKLQQSLFYGGLVMGFIGFATSKLI